MTGTPYSLFPPEVTSLMAEGGTGSGSVHAIAEALEVLAQQYLGMSEGRKAQGVGLARSMESSLASPAALKVYNVIADDFKAVGAHLAALGGDVSRVGASIDVFEPVPVF